VGRLGIGLDDFSDDVLFECEANLIQMDRLNSQLYFVAQSNAIQLTANVVLDLFLVACLVPSATVLGPPEKHDTDLHFEYTANVTRHWIQGLPPDLAIEVVKVCCFVLFCFVFWEIVLVS
jgi:hypothetical protein